MDMFTIERNGRIFTTAEAKIISKPDELPREIASALPSEKLNDSYVWIAGRFVQAGVPNKNGHFWELEDLEFGNSSIKHTPMNMLHQWARPVGTFVDSKIVNRVTASEGTGTPEIQALAVLWGASFTEAASTVRQHHEEGNLWFSMECVAESKKCMTCGETFPWKTPNELACEHLAASPIAKRRLIKPTFVGGALIFPPEAPAWPDADVTEVAKDLTIEYADHEFVSNHASTFSVEEWEAMMDLTIV